MAKRYEQWQGFASSGMEEAEDGTYVLHSEYAAIAERCERLEEALRVVMQPYGMYDKAVHNTFGHGQDQILEAGRNIRDLLYGRNGDKE